MRKRSKEEESDTGKKTKLKEKGRENEGWIRIRERRERYGDEEVRCCLRKDEEEEEKKK